MENGHGVTATGAVGGGIFHIPRGLAVGAVAGLVSGFSTLLREPSAGGDPGGEGWNAAASPVVLCDGLALCRALVADAAGVAGCSGRAPAEVAAQQEAGLPDVAGAVLVHSVAAGAASGWRAVSSPRRPNFQ